MTAHRWTPARVLLLREHVPLGTPPEAIQRMLDAAPGTPFPPSRLDLIEKRAREMGLQWPGRMTVAERVAARG